MFFGRCCAKLSRSVLLQAFTIKITRGAIGNIAEKKEREKELTEGEGDAYRNDDNNESMKRGASLPGNGFETGICDVTDH